jgi:hypothetical protein
MKLVCEVMILVEECTKPNSVPREADAGLHVLLCHSYTYSEYDSRIRLSTSHCYKALDKLLYAYTYRSLSFSWRWEIVMGQ